MGLGSGRLGTQRIYKAWPWNSVLGLKASSQLTKEVSLLVYTGDTWETTWGATWYWAAVGWRQWGLPGGHRTWAKGIERYGETEKGSMTKSRKKEHNVLWEHKTIYHPCLKCLSCLYCYKCLPSARQHLKHGNPELLAPGSSRPIPRKLQYSRVHNNIPVNDRQHIQQWSHKIIIITSKKFVCDVKRKAGLGYLIFPWVKVKTRWPNLGRICTSF